jgi:beta-glucosidase/6-phospho-beta-glucosidase/beta-galactosidase
VFSSFLQAGFECSTHKLRDGRRLDLVSSTFHDRYLEKDYERMLQMGMSTAREGLRWHLIEPRPNVYDFSSVLPFIEAAQRMGIQIVWDLLHFGWPDYLDIFSEAWRESFTQFAAKFGQLLRAQTSTTAYIAPINEISFLSWAAGDNGHVFPFEHGRGSELKLQLVRAAVAASEVIKSELADSRLVSPEPVIHIIGDPKRPEDVRQAEAYRTSMFEAWDMLAGRIHPELGGSEKFLDVIGINYYDRNQWWNHGQTIFRGEPEYRPFREILREVYKRYRRPMFIAETGTEGAKRPEWFGYISEEVNAARQSGVDLHGICLYPVVNHPGWNDDRHCYNGLWDYPDATGNRETYQPLADEIRKQEHLWKGMAESA